jgi:thymidylate synthase (FAD)
MPQVRLRVTLLESTKDALSIIYAAYRQCYSQEFSGDLFGKHKEGDEEQVRFIRNTLASGHESPLEHVKFTFAVEGVSRALTHQLVRHRVCSFSQQSQKYVKETNFDYIIPPSIELKNESRLLYEKLMKDSQEAYDLLRKILIDNGMKSEEVNQDARFVLPNAAETKIVVTMNCRELLHFFSVRCCNRAQWEIRALAYKMLEICKEKLPVIFDNGGPKCFRFGYCPEGERFSCGKYPLKKDFLGESK